MIGKFIKFFVMGILALVGIGLALAAVGVAIGLAVLAVKIGVIVAIGYGAYRLIGGGSRKTKAPEISEADRRWLES